MDSCRISIVVPVYNEECQIEKTLREINRILSAESIGYEFIIIDDGSTDDSWDVIRRLISELPALSAYRFSRNFGKEAALCAGIAMAQGQACITMDADLQHPPEIIPEMVRLWRQEKYQIVEAVKKSRGKESGWSRLRARLFYSAFNKLSGIDLTNASDFKLMDAQVVGAWLSLTERNTFYRGMINWLGFRRISVPFEVVPRIIGKSKWSGLHLAKLAVTAITSFSTLPLQVVTFLGLLFFVLAIPLGIQTLYMKFLGHAVSGFTTVILLLLIIGSCLMLSLGIIGTYIAKIYEEVKRRPRYLIVENLTNID